MKYKMYYLIFLLATFFVNVSVGQSSECTFQIVTSDLCPSELISEVISNDSLVSQTDGSELIRNTNGRLISVGGWDGVGLSHNRIRYSDDDGVTWHVASNGTFTGRHIFSIIEDDGFFYLIGGDNNNTVAERSEIWKSPSNDGLIWTLHSDDTPFGNHVLYQVIVFNGNWYAVGGQVTNNGAILGYALRAVYISLDKGVSWTLLNQGVMPEVGTTWACTVVFKNKVWIVSGGTYNYSTIVSNKVYSTTDLLTWVEETDFVLPIGLIFNRVFADSTYIWTHGGYDYGSGNTNFTYVSKDGKIWCDVTNPNAPLIHAAAVVNMPNGWISNQPFSAQYGVLGGVCFYQIGSYHKCLTNTNFVNSSGDNLWSNPDNWSRGIPTQNHFVTILNGKTCSYNISNYKAGKIIVEQNAILNLNNNLKVLGSDTFGIKNFGTINLSHGTLDIDSIYGSGIINYGNVNVTNNFFLNIKNCGCSGLINDNGELNVVNYKNLYLTMLNIEITGIYNNGQIIFRGNGSLIDLNANGIINLGLFENYGNLFIQCKPTFDYFHLNNSGNFINYGTLIGQSKLGLNIMPSGTIENFGNIQNSGNVTIGGFLFNKSTGEFTIF